MTVKIFTQVVTININSLERITMNKDHGICKLSFYLLQKA